MVFSRFLGKKDVSYSSEYVSEFEDRMHSITGQDLVIVTRAVPLNVLCGKQTTYSRWASCRHSIELVI